MLFNSLNFIVFFPIVVTAYFVIPDRIKHLWLLAASYYFYMCWNAKYALLILTSTIITYASGLAISKVREAGNGTGKGKKLKSIVALSFISNLGILVYFKYTNFFITVLAGVLERVGIQLSIPTLDIILPVGISFYTFQALSYTMDVYRGEIKAEKDFFRYALFVSFFPQLVAGPIERSKNLLKQLEVSHRFDFENFREGLLLMLWGFFLKIVMADRIAIFVDAVYGDYAKYNGTYIVVATVLFAFQIYCDFAGYSSIAVGASRIIGIRLMENFNAPYLSTSVTEFWRNWHISLTSWFKDYLYIPLGGNRKGTARKYLNIFIVFAVSGLWHGASLSFVMWGALNGIYQIIGGILKPVRDRLVKALQLNRESFGHKLVSGLVTFILVDFSWIFFRAGTLTEALDIIRSMIHTYNPWVLFDGGLYKCMEEKDFRLMICLIFLLIVVDICKKRGICIRKFVMSQDYWFRWVFIALAINIILLFGMWGLKYDAASFIYFQF